MDMRTAYTRAIWLYFCRLKRFSTFSPRGKLFSSCFLKIGANRRVWRARSLSFRALVPLKVRIYADCRSFYS